MRKLVQASYSVAADVAYVVHTAPVPVMRTSFTQVQIRTDLVTEVDCDPGKPFQAPEPLVSAVRRSSKLL